MKPGGKAYLSTIRGEISYVDDEEWETVLNGFKVEDRNRPPHRGERWAVVTKPDHE